MKRVNEYLKRLLLMAASVAMLIAPACSDSEELDTTPEPKPRLELTIKLGATTHNTIVASVTPSIEEAAYYAAIHSADEVGEDLGESLALQLAAADNFANSLRKGAQRVEGTNLNPESDYYVVAFGYDIEKKAMTTDVVLSSKITTQPEPGPTYPGLLTLEIQEESITWRDAYVKVESNDEEMEYIFGVVSKEKFDTEYAENTELIIADCIAQWEHDAIVYSETYPNNTWLDYMMTYQQIGSKTINVREYENVRWSQEYVCYTFGMNDAGEVTALPATAPFRMATPVPSENVITITINQTTDKSVEFTVTTTNDDPYYLTIEQKAYWDRFGEGKEESYDDLVFDQTFHKTDEAIASKVFSGTRTFTQEDLGKTVNGFREYQVAAFGLDNGPTTDVVFSEVFKPGTTHQPEPETAFEVTITDPTWCNATVDVKPLKEGKYMWGGFTKAVWEEKYAADVNQVYEFHKKVWENDAEIYSQSWQQQIQYYDQEGENLGVSAGDIVGAARLAWGTEYVLYFFGIDESTGEMTTQIETHEFSTLAPTPSSNTFAITILATTKSSADFTITPSTNDPYYVTIEKKSSIESWGEEIITKTIPEYDNQLEQRTFTGTQTLTQADLGKSVNGFAEYQVIVYGFENGPTTAVTLSEAFKPGTTHQPESETAFEVTITDPTWCNASVDVKPLKEGKYMWGGFTKTVWEEKYAADTNQVYEFHKKVWENDAEIYSQPWQQQIQYYDQEGENLGVSAGDIVGASRLAWGTEYVLYFFGIDESTGEMTTQIETHEFSTLAPTPSSNTFTITIDAMTRSSVEFTITPTTNDPYYVTIEKKSNVESWGEEIIAKTIPEYDNQLEQRTFTGTQTLTQADLGKTVNGFAEYQVIVYGFENGPTTAVTLSEAFKPADPE